jgi:DNA-binding transcriptional MerR regulator
MIGLVQPRTRPGKTGRYFDDKLIRRIRLIRQLNDVGYTLREIRQTYLRRR